MRSIFRVMISILLLAGTMVLISGGSEAANPRMRMDLGRSDASFQGEDIGDNSGYSVAVVGDVNGDGYDDILIGAFQDDDGGSDAGQTYLILGKASGWAMDTDLSGASASFWGEDAGDVSGLSVAGAGDVNGDGFDDILIGAPYDDDGGSDAGQTYLILGKASGWSMDTDLSGASASFWGEDAVDYSGRSVAGVGDVNGDGYDDFLIGAYGDDDGGSGAGQTYLILGKASGWSMDTDLSGASASFWGEDSFDLSGYNIAGAGDVNGDGYDDILIGAYGDSDGGTYAGQTYLILGKASGWAMDKDLTDADASFCGENDYDVSGVTVSCSGDVNGDGFDDILIGAQSNDDGGTDSGQTYLILSGVDPPGPRNLRYALSSAVTRVTLNWDAPNSWAEPLEAYRIYRSSNGLDYQYLGFTSSSMRTYADNAVSIGVTYHYMVVADYDEGWENSGKAYLTVVCDRDSDMDGIGNLADIDDDNDGYPDHSDSFPLDKTEWLDTDWDGAGNNADTDDDNDGVPDKVDLYPLDPLNYISMDLRYMNSTLDGIGKEIDGLVKGISDLGSDIATLSNEISQISDSISLLSTSLSTSTSLIRGDITAMGFDLSTRIGSLQSDLGGVNSSLMSSLTDLQGQLSSLTTSFAEDLQGLEDRMDELDSDISDQFGSLELAISQFKTEVSSDLTDLLTALEAHDTDMSGYIEELSTMLGSISTATLPAMMASLNRIGSEIRGANDTLDDNDKEILDLIDDIQGDVSDLRADSGTALLNISEMIKALDSIQVDIDDLDEDTSDQLGSISDRVILIEDLSGDIQDEQDSTSSKVGGLTVHIIILMILVIMAMIAVGANIFITLKARKENW